jgi:hypothetical protein
MENRWEQRDVRQTQLCLKRIGTAGMLLFRCTNTRVSHKCIDERGKAAGASLLVVPAVMAAP